jgi:hypothetical protein
MLISSQMARAIPDDSPLHPFILYSPNSAFKLACEIVRPSFADFDTNLSLPRGRKRSLPKEMEGLSVGDSGVAAGTFIRRTKIRLEESHGSLMMSL